MQFLLKKIGKLYLIPSQKTINKAKRTKNRVDTNSLELKKLLYIKLIADGNPLATIPQKMIIDEPFPIPPSLIFSESHIIRRLEVTILITVVTLKTIPGFMTKPEIASNPKQIATD